MKNLAPEIFRQRLLIEGYYSIAVGEKDIDLYLRKVVEHLSLRMYSDPVIYATTPGMGKAENSGFDAFVPLIDSGISVYIWSQAQFFSVVIYSCKGFDENAAIEFTRAFFRISGDLAHMSI